MNPNSRVSRVKEKLMNKSFYRFLFSFIAVIAGVLLFILVVGVGSGVQ
ncbi:hypothetical protein H6787_01145 [Candidatus Nomurabacteria bacterium]|nr:hypothetical protein [Candidatus Nomurabacteria bacterium]